MTCVLTQKPRIKNQCLQQTAKGTATQVKTVGKGGSN